MTGASTDRSLLPRALNSRSLALLVASLVLFPLLLNAGYLREDIHQVLFPICILAIWRLPRNAEMRLPAGLVAAVLGLWVLATLHVSGLLPELQPSGYVLLGRLDGDADGLQARAVYKRYSEIARTYQLMPVDQVYRTFSNTQDAASWVALERRKSPMIVFGEPAAMRIVLNPEIGEMLLQSALNLSPVKPADSNAWSSLEKYAATTTLSLWWSGETFLLRLMPKELPLPGNSLEQSLHFLAYLAQALRFEDPSEAIVTRIQNLASRRDALYGIVNLEGPWGSGAMLGFARYLLGTLGLLEAVTEGGVNAALLEDSLKQLTSASSLVVRRHDPELYIDVFNNAALGLLATSQDDYDLRRAHRWLLAAFDIAGTYGLTELGATVQANLIALERTLNGPPHKIANSGDEMSRD